MKPATKEAYRLLHDGSLALAQIERNGMFIDTKYLKKTILKSRAKAQELKEELLKDDAYKIWRKVYGHKANLGSLEQLACVVFDKMGYPSLSKTRTGRHKADEEAFEHVDLPFVKRHIRMRKFEKIESTYLNGIRTELDCNGYIHPNFNLNLAISFRSTCDTPNSQNFPVRDLELAEMVRRCFVPRDKDNQIGELDFKGVEVCIGACYHKDPMMIAYIKDKTKDMHRDMAMECYILKQEQVTKDSRYAAKNTFVFPEFYGDYYIRCAISLWEAIDRLKLTTVDGTPLRDHLRRQGIKELGDVDPSNDPGKGSFVAHLKKVEERFWGKRFKVYAAWKDSFFEEFQRKGYFRSKTGFLYQGYDRGGVLRKNQVVNFPIQGSAFHCDLWTIIELQKWMNKKKLKSVLIGQIHDSMIGDFNKDEKDYILGKAKRLITEDLPRHWDWINVPLGIECEVAPLGKSWFDKKEYKI